MIEAVGRLKAGPERELVDRYVGRAKALGRGLGFGGPDILEVDESRARSVPERRRDEAAALFGKLLRGSQVFVFDETGRNFTSPEFAERVTRARSEGASALTVVIGGPDGLLPEVRTKADELLGFGSATLPHQLVRVLVAEQIYRTMTILSRHPYHRG